MRCGSHKSEHMNGYKLSCYTEQLTTYFCQYLNQYQSIFNWTPRNKFWWRFNQNSSMFPQGNICKRAVFLPRPQSVKTLCQKQNLCGKSTSPAASPHRGSQIWKGFSWDIAFTEIILGMGSANERWCYFVTSSLIGWAYTQNDHCFIMMSDVYFMHTRKYQWGTIPWWPCQGPLNWHPTILSKSLLQMNSILYLGAVSI